MTSPAASRPGVNGNSGLTWYLPATISVSAKLTPQAWTRMRASFEPSGPRATSSTRRLSGPPHSRHRTAFMPFAPQSRANDRRGGSGKETPANRFALGQVDSAATDRLLPRRCFWRSAYERVRSALEIQYVPCNGHARRLPGAGAKAGRRAASLSPRQPGQHVDPRGGHLLDPDPGHGGHEQPGHVRPAQGAEQPGDDCSRSRRELVVER